jgi:hypothetical protein
MEISSMTLTPSTKAQGALAGWGEVVFDEILTIRITVMKNGTDGSLFVSWPSKPSTGDQGGYFKLVLWEKSPATSAIEAQIIGEFNKALGVTNGKAAGKKQDEAPPAEPKEAKPIIGWA